MLFNFQSAGPIVGEAMDDAIANSHWRADSEYGILTDVLVAAPRHLEIVPCNSVSIENHERGVTCCPDLASEQHAAFVRALERAGVRCHFVPPLPGLADLSFTRDSTLMTPWGLLGLRPALGHRLPEVAHVLTAAAAWGVPTLGSVSEGRIEGGDICLLQPGIVVIGLSGDRTDATGARALAKFVETRGWRAILTRFDPHFLHLDTLFTMVDRGRAVACVEALEPGFLLELQEFGIEIIPASEAEVHRLGANLFSLGGKRLLSPAGNDRINEHLRRIGYTVIPIDIDQFTRCGGGLHCLTMPLARQPG